MKQFRWLLMTVAIAVSPGSMFASEAVDDLFGAGVSSAERAAGGGALQDVADESTSTELDLVNNKTASIANSVNLQEAPKSIVPAPTEAPQVELPSEPTTTPEPEYGPQVNKDSIDQSLRDNEHAADRRVEAAQKKVEALENDPKAGSAAKEAAKQELEDAKNDLDVAKNAVDDAEARLKGVSSLVDKTKNMAKDTIQDISKSFKKFNEDKFGHIADATMSIGRKAGGLISHVAETLGGAILFMVPNIFQSEMQAKIAQQAALAKLVEPAIFGGLVLQIPDSCFDLKKPSRTLPIYVSIPAKTVTETISSDVYKLFGGSISGPSDTGTISQAIHASLTEIMSGILAGGSNISSRPQRYNINESAYFKKANFLVTYGSGGFPVPASCPLTSSQFPGFLADLNTGLVIDATGEQNSIWPLLTNVVDPHDSAYIPATGSAASVQAFLPTMLGQIELTENLKNTKALESEFNCRCIGAVANNPDDSTATCSSGECLITKSLNLYMSGVSINADGKPGLKSQAAGDVTTVAVPGLGSVIPMYGWGETGYAKIINENNFPNNSPVDLSQSSLIKLLPKSGKSFWLSAVAPIANKPSAASDDVVDPNAGYKFADADGNYQAQGCWVYLCANTPFAHALQGSQSQSKNETEASPYGPDVDYIIFLDENAQQVPLMAPIMQDVAVGSAVNWPTIGINPAIKYWASLISTFLPSFNQDGGPVIYTLQGQAASGADIISTAQAAIGQLTKYKNTSTGQSVPTFPKLAQQFMIHSQAMLSKFFYGPFHFGNISLIKSRYGLAPAAGATGSDNLTMSLYRGSKCYASPVNDLVYVVDSSGNPLELPDSLATNVQSLITDITYTVQTDGSLKATDFSQAPLIKIGNSYALNKSQATVFNALTSLESAAGGVANIDPKLKAYVSSQRKAWFNNFDNSSEAQGYNIGDVTIKLAAGISSINANATRCFMYEISPSPTAAITDQDLFILANSQSPILSALAPISAKSVKKGTMIVSLVTGLCFDFNGNQLFDGSNNALRVKTPATATTTIGDQIYQAMIAKYPVGKGMTAEFKTRYDKMVARYDDLMYRPQGPYSFGPLNLGIFAGDAAVGNYVYFPAGGMHKGEDYIPNDMFITIQLPTVSGKPTLVGQKLDNSTLHVMSLISGELFDVSGLVSKLSVDKLLESTAQMSVRWSPWLIENMTRLQKNMADSLAAEKAEQVKLDADLKVVSDFRPLLSPASVKTIIGQLTPSGAQGLATPFGSIKFNPLQQMFAYLSPASTLDPEDFLYMFFDLPSTLVDSDGKQERVGAVYRSNGEQVRTVTGVELKATAAQYGIVINAVDHGQHLGVPLLQPTLIMTDVDKVLVPGKSGESMIVSTASDFPGKKVTLAKGYHLYFSKIMGTYYAYDIKNRQWISIKGGDIYEKDGMPAVLQQQVATSASANDLLLLYKNNAGYEQFYKNGINYRNLNDMGGAAITLTSSIAPYVAKNVTKKGNRYTVDGATYSVNSDFNWQSLILIPIDSAGLPLATQPSSSYSDAALVFAKKAISHFMFNGKMYKNTVGASSAKTSFRMVPINGSGLPITLSLGLDDGTGAPFVLVTQAGVSYKYGFLFNHLSRAQRASYSTRVWNGAVVTCPIALPIGPMAQQTKTIGGKLITVSVPDDATHVLFIPNVDVKSLKGLNATNNIINAPAANTAEGRLLALNLFRIFSATDGRFFASMYPSDDTDSGHLPVVPYFNMQGYVDIETGALFSDEGLAIGYSLNLDDWLDLLNKLQVSVVQNAAGLQQLMYRSADTVSAQSKLFAATNKVVKVTA